MGHRQKKPPVFLGQRGWVCGGLASLGWQSGGDVGEALAVEACPPGAVRLHRLTPDLHRDERLGAVSEPGAVWRQTPTRVVALMLFERTRMTQVTHAQ